MSFDPNWPHGHQTCSGKAARIICTDARVPNRPIAALVDLGDTEQFTLYTADGRAFTEGSYGLDLRNAPAPKKRVKGWINIYAHGRNSLCMQSRSQADHVAATMPEHERRVACVFIDVEEGEGL